jgi:hypothetical protein
MFGGRRTGALLGAMALFASARGISVWLVGLLRGHTDLPSDVISTVDVVLFVASAQLVYAWVSSRHPRARATRTNRRSAVTGDHPPDGAAADQDSASGGS